LAAKRGNLAVVQALLDAGADINIENQVSVGDIKKLT